MPEGKPSAEVVATPIRAEDITWMEASVWTPRMVAALEQGVEGGRWYSLIDKVHRKENLKAAYERTKRNKGTHGVDNVSIRFFGKYLEENLDKLNWELKAGTYRPQRLRRIYIPKPGSGEKRPISIPTVKDRVVHGAVKHVIEPIFERTFADTSYGFRPNRNAKQALRRVEKELNLGTRYVIDCDFKSYFDTIPHDKLMAKVRELITDTKLLKLLELMLRQGIMETHKQWTPTQGTPQGGVISPLLANIYLNELDHQLIKAGVQPTRYAGTIERVNRTVRGWYNYFQESIPTVFPEVDGFIRRRLRAILLKRHHTPGFGTASAHQRWPNSYFAAQKLFSTTVASATAVYSARR